MLEEEEERRMRRRGGGGGEEEDTAKRREERGETAAAGCALHESAGRAGHVDGLRLAAVVADLKLYLLFLLERTESLSCRKYNAR